MLPADRHARITGVACLLVTAFGWGLNWPATKFLITECPPLSARGVSGVVASLALGVLAASRGERLAVPQRCYGRLARAALLNVTAWMGLSTLSLLWLRAGEAATLAYTMPVWAALLAWPVLGEKLGPRRIIALLLGFGGVAVTVGGSGVRLEAASLPGIGIALSAALLFAFGTVMSKRAPIDMPPLALTAWQVGLGCVPLLVVGLTFEDAHFLRLPLIGWLALAYTAVMSLGLCYIAWFAAVRRLKAGVAAIGTLLTPIIGVVASALILGEPLMLPQVGALSLVIGAVILAVTA